MSVNQAINFLKQLEEDPSVKQRVAGFRNLEPNEKFERYAEVARDLGYECSANDLYAVLYVATNEINRQNYQRIVFWVLCAIGFIAALMGQYAVTIGLLVGIGYFFRDKE